ARSSPMSTTTRKRELRLAMVWNQAVQGEELLKERKAVTLGYGPDAVFPLPEAQAARGDLTLLTPLAEGYILLLPPDARGAVWLSGTRREVRELLVSNPSVTLGPD